MEMEELRSVLVNGLLEFELCWRSTRHVADTSSGSVVLGE